MKFQREVKLRLWNQVEPNHIRPENILSLSIHWTEIAAANPYTVTAYCDRKGNIFEYEISWVKANYNHRADGPAMVIWRGGPLNSILSIQNPTEIDKIKKPELVQEHWFNSTGEYHRLDGPALTACGNGRIVQEWHVDGKLLPISGPQLTIKDLWKIIRFKPQLREYAIKLGQHHKLITESQLKTIGLLQNI